MADNVLPDEDTLLLREPATHFEPRADSGYVGLDNQSATCYMNSLIQTLFMTPDLRTALFGLTDEELGVEFLGEDDGPAQHDIDALTAMGFPESGVIKALTKHPGDREAAMEWLFTYDASQDPDSGKTKPKSKGKAWKVPIALRLLFAQLQKLDQKSVSTVNLTDSFGWSQNAVSVQHDVHELNRVLIDALDKSLQTTKAKSLCASLYKGSHATRIMCMECGYISERKEEYFDLSCPVQGVDNLVDSLAELCQYETLYGPNQYRCSTCSKKVDAVRSTRLKTMPPILTLCLSRFFYNRVTQKRQKITKKFAYPLSIDLGPLLDTGDFSTNAKQAYEAWKVRREEEMKKERERKAEEEKKRKKREEENRGLPYNGNMQAAIRAKDRAAIKILMKAKKEKQRKIVEQEKQAEAEAAGVPTENTEATQKSEAATKESLKDEIKKEIKKRETLMKSVVQEGSKHIYDLKAVIIHQGTAYRGHYHAYIVSEDGKQWLNFDDSRVTEIPTATLAQQYSGANENAYMLIYRLRGTGDVQPKLPEHLDKEIAEANSKMKPRRERYVTLINRVSLFLHRDTMFEVAEDGFLTTISSQTSNAIKLDVDRRTPVLKVKQMIQDKLKLQELPILSIMLRPEGIDGLQCGKDLEDGKLTLELSGVSNNQSNILVWNGKSINGKPFVPDPDIGKFIFEAIYYQIDDEPKPLRLAVPPGCNFEKLAEVLNKKVGLPNDHSKIMYHLMYQGADPMIMELQKYKTNLVRDTGVMSKGVVLGIELNTGQGSEGSVTNTYFTQSKDKLELKIINNTVKSKPYKTIEIIKSGTLALVKTKIRKTFNKEDIPEKFCLRHMLGPNKPGAIFKDEKGNLEILGITEQGTALLVEPESMELKSEEISILYSITKGKNKFADRIPLTVHLTTTIGELKTQILESQKLKNVRENMAVFYTKGDPQLEHVGAYGKGKMITDEKRTVQDAGLINRGSVWVSDTKRKLDGSTNLNVYLYTDYQLNTVEAFQGARELLKKQINDGGEGDQSLMVIEEEEVQLPYGGNMEKAMRLRDRAAIKILMNHRKQAKSKPAEKKTSELKAIFEMPFQCNLSLFDLKCAIQYHPSGLIPKESLRKMRIYLLNSNLTLGSVVRSDASSLISQGVIGDMDIAVQILPFEEVGLCTNAIAVKLSRCCPALGAEKEALIMLKTKAKPVGEKKVEEEQARKRVKVEEEIEPSFLAVFGPNPPPLILLDTEMSSKAERTPYNPWSNIKEITPQIAKNLSATTKLPKSIREAFLGELKLTELKFPPMEVEGKALSLEDLSRYIVALSGIPQKSIGLLKWFHQGQRWHVLSKDLEKRLPGGDVQGEGKKTSESLADFPFSIKDGDFIAFVDRREFKGCETEEGFERLAASLGSRKFISTRKMHVHSDDIQKFAPREEILKIHI